MRGTELLATMRLDTSQFDRGLQGSQAGLRQFALTASSIPGAGGNVFGAMARDAAGLMPILGSLPLGIAAVGVAMTVAGASARSAGVEFEASLAKISTLGDDATKTLGATRQAILDAYATIPTSGGLNDLAEANYLLQSSGRSAEQAIEDLRVAAVASVGGFTSTSVAVDGLTTVTNAWKDANITTQHASDVLFQSVNFGKVTFEGLAKEIGVVAPVAAAAGVRFEEVAAAAAVLSNQGVRTATIMEGLRGAIINILKPTANFKTAYADLATEFTASRLARDGIIQFLRDFDTASGSSQNALHELIPEAVGFTVALGLLKNHGDDAAKSLHSMETAIGGADAAAKRMTETTKGQEQLIRNQLTVAWTGFGELLNTVTLPILDKIGRALNLIRGGTIYASRDVASLIASQKTGDSDAQRRSLVKVADQYRADPSKFIASLSVDELKSLRDALLKDNASANAIPIRVLTDIATALRDRAIQAQAEARATAEGRADSRTHSVAVAEDERKRIQNAKDRVDAKERADAAAKERERIINDADKLIQDLETKIADALEGPAALLQGALAKRIEEAKKAISSGVLSPENRKRLQADLDKFVDVQTQLITATNAATETQAAITAAGDAEEVQGLKILGDRERILQVLLDSETSLKAQAETESQLLELRQERGRVTKSVFSLPTGDAEAKDLKERVKQYGELATAIGIAGDALGLLPKRAGDALKGIGQLAQQGSKIFDKGFAQLGSVEKLTSYAGLIGGIASLASALFAPDPIAIAQKENLERNTEALKNLTEHIGDLSGSSVSGATLAAVLVNVTNAAKLTDEVSRYDRRITLGARDPGAFVGRAEFGAATPAQVTDVAKALGITLDGTAAAYYKLAEAIRAADLASYTDTFAGSLAHLSDVLSVEGITDPLDQLTRKVAVLVDKKTGFPALATALTGIDLTSVEGRSAAQQKATDLFNALASGKLTASDLGGLSINDARAALVDLIDSLRKSVSGSATGTGGFNETRSITEVTGSRLAGLLGTGNTYLASIALDVAAMRAVIAFPAVAAIRPPALPTGFGAAASGIVITGGLNITIALSRELLGSDAGTASQLGDTFGRALGSSLITSIDQQLREQARRQKLLIGDTVLTS